MDQATLQICQQKLLDAKADLLNRFQTHRLDFSERDSKGDEADQTASMMNETQLLASQRRMREQLVEIESALARIAQGTYGICEETMEPIERERLFAIPWTRLSLEGAEIRESNSTQAQ